MNKKLGNLSVVLASLIGYLEWGVDQHSFLVQAEMEVLTRLWSDPWGVVHPLTMIPLMGQLVLVITLFQKQVSRKLTRLGILALAILFGVILLVGLWAPNWKMVLSVVPFFICSYWVLWKIKG